MGVTAPVCSGFSTRYDVVFSAMLFGTIFILLGLTEGQDCPGGGYHFYFQEFLISKSEENSRTEKLKLIH